MRHLFCIRENPSKCVNDRWENMWGKWNTESPTCQSQHLGGCIRRAHISTSYRDWGYPSYIRPYHEKQKRKKYLRNEDSTLEQVLNMDLEPIPLFPWKIIQNFTFCSCVRLPYCQIKWEVFSTEMLDRHVLMVKQLYLWKCRLCL